MVSTEEVFGKFSSMVYSIAERIFLRWIHSEAVMEVRRVAREGFRILEVGFGTGRVAEIIVRGDPSVEIMGIDVSLPMVTRASRRARKLPNFHPTQGISRLIPYRSDYFDLAFTVLSLHHWGDKEGSLAEIRRVLRSGGYLLVVEYDKDKAIIGLEKGHAMTNKELQDTLNSYFNDVHVVTIRGLLVGIGRKS